MLTSFLSLPHATQAMGLLAYLDPGTGSFLLQIALAGMLAGLFSIKRFYKQIKSSLVSPAHEDD